MEDPLDNFEQLFLTLSDPMHLQVAAADLFVYYTEDVEEGSSHANALASSLLSATLQIHPCSMLVPPSRFCSIPDLLTFTVEG